MTNEDSVSPPDGAGHDRPRAATRFGRRTFLAAVGATAVAGGMSTGVSAAPPYVVEQGDTTTEITPLSGDTAVEDLLSYQLPDGQYDGTNGARDDGGPYFAITGVEDKQRDNTTIMFLYDGPNGLSLVVVHGHVESSSSEGASVSFSLTGMPSDGTWVVKDDYYLDPDTGEPAGTNYDNWNVDGTSHTIDWTYGDSRTDGGAYRALGDSFAITIDPSFNDESPLYEQYYTGDLTDWEILSGDFDDPDRTSLSMDQSVTVGTSDQMGAEPTYTVTQGDTEFEVTPFSGTETAEELYDLRLPDSFEGDNGATDPGSGPYYQSVGTQDIQAESTTISFLYDGPDGLSLVVVHDTDGGDGGSATWTVTGLPQDGSWVVKDDLYLDPDTGEPAGSNYDVWDTDGSEDTIDWTWGAGGTDGGAFRPLGDAFSFTIDPAYNEDAALYEEYYSGDIVDWEFLSGSQSDPDRTSLALDQSVTVTGETPTPPPAPTYTLQQGDTTVEIEAVQGFEPVEDLYDLQIPDRFEGTDGASDTGGPYYRSLGLTDVQAEGETAMFLYDGPNGLSLVVVHGADGGSSGGSATWTVTGLPQEGSWVVKDDYYIDPDTGDIAASNYDVWDTDGSEDTVDWTWGDSRTDGGAFRDLGDSFTITIDPAYNEAAALYEEYYTGDVSNWRVLSGSLDSPETTSLALDEPVTITTGDPDEATFGVSTVSASESDSVVTLTGRLDGLGTLDAATVYFKYWETGSKESTTYWWTGTEQSSTGTFSTDLDLDSGTSYSFRALANGSDGTWTVGSVQEVTTSGQRFGVTTDGATDVTESGATLNGTLSGLGDAASATVYFEFWVDGQRDDSYWWTGDARSSTGAFSTTLDLAAGTTYQYRALAQTDAGKWRAGAESSFTTEGTAFGVETDPATNVTESGATLNGTLTGLGDADSATVYFTYWRAGERSSTLRWYTGTSRTSAGSFSADRTLTSGTYRFQALAQDATGAWKAGSEQEFTVP
jgi:LysM repeat protein